ncbi:hypothetical protein PLESTB_000659700 [Pleodorina starrii]|uniref:Uncharacterized protein n=1 Tax=Pleodorina starrii TaxID=330485 RepID=A0A9W6F1E9_9CHLO|nr:hypothetical protein PLESTM_001320800 [Pleodorina starrii]GLC52709.1 hypothetical protein PLESTB_000659700 [Pleodorina starrii]
MAPRRPQQDEALPLLEQQEPRKKKSTLLTVCPFILGNEFCERLAYYGLATNLVMYITTVMGGDPADAAIQVSVFEGTCYLTPLIGAYLADSRWGRYKTILVFSSIYLVGMVMLALTSWLPGLTPPEGEEATWPQLGALIASLSIIALGTGGIKPNVSAFGADQFNEADPQDRREKESFFNWFYLAINVGSLIACTVIVFIQDQVSWTLGYGIPAVVMATAVLLFVAGRKVYRHVLPTESPMERVVRVVAAAMHNRWIKKKGVEPRAADSSSLHGGHLYTGAANGTAGAGERPANGGGNGHRSLMLGGAASPLPSYLDLATAVGGGGGGGGGDDGDDAVGGGGGRRRFQRNMSVPMSPSMSHRWLEDAITDWQTSQGTVMHMDGLAGHYTPQQVEEVKMVLRLMPVFFTTMLYWTIYTQMGSFFVQQGNLMARDVVLPSFSGSGSGSGSSWTFHVPSASMSLFNTLSIIVLIPVYDKLLEPAITRIRGKITLLQRIGWGMVLAVVSMLVAAWVEWYRLRSLAGCRNSQEREGALLLGRALLEPAAGEEGSLPGDLSAPAPACSLSIFWQAPQYFIVGASEVLASIGQLEFFYDQAPDVMRSCSMALQLASTAIGSYLSGIIVWAVQAGSPAIAGRQWLPRDLNAGRLDLFFVFMAVLMAISTAAFVAVAMSYTYKQVEHKRRVIQPRVSGAGQPSLVAAPPPGRGPQYPRSGAAAAAAAAAAQGMPGAAAPVVIRGRGAAAAAAAEVPEPTPEELDMYGRSLAYVPPSPALPAPFR